MADIDVQKKEGPNIWPWIIGLAVLALIVWVVLNMGDDEPEDDIMLRDDTTVVSPTAPPAPMPADTGFMYSDTLTTPDTTGL